MSLALPPISSLPPSSLPALLSSHLPASLRRLLRRLHLLPAPLTPLTASDTLWLYDTLAYPSPTSASGWACDFVAAIFTLDSGRDVARVVGELADTLGLAPDDEDGRNTIAQRVQPFVDTVAEGRVVQVLFEREREVVLGPSDGAGVCWRPAQPLPVGTWRDGMEVVSTAVLPPSPTMAAVSMQTRFAGASGWAVVSDVDDTIKTSDVLSPLSVLRHTFVLPASHPADMPSFYAHLHQRLSPAWFYLSASPYNLYPALHRFLRAHYPFGQLLLREITLQSPAALLSSLTVGTQSYKQAELARLLTAVLPARWWVLIGDSTQRDPEAYAHTYRLHPARVKRVWIRIVRGVDAEKESVLNGEERFEVAFRGVPRGVWRTFVDAAELQGEVDRLLEEG